MNIVDNFAWPLSILSDKREFFFKNLPYPPAPNSQLPVHVVLIGEPLAFAKEGTLANDLDLINDSHP